MSSSARIFYTSESQDITPKSEATVLANVYSFVLRCGEARRTEEKTKGGSATAPDARKEIDGSGKTIVAK
jgi:hypothetical protein